MGVQQETLPPKCKEKPEGNPVLSPTPKENGSRALSFTLKSSKLGSSGSNSDYLGGVKTKHANSPKVFMP